MPTKKTTEKASKLKFSTVSVKPKKGEAEADTKTSKKLKISNRSLFALNAKATPNPVEASIHAGPLTDLDLALNAIRKVYENDPDSIATIVYFARKLKSSAKSSGKVSRFKKDRKLVQLYFNFENS